MKQERFEKITKYNISNELKYSFFIILSFISGILIAILFFTTIQFNYSLIALLFISATYLSLVVLDVLASKETYWVKIK